MPSTALVRTSRAPRRTQKRITRPKLVKNGAKPNRNQLLSQLRVLKPMMSKAGLDFLKCATAAPDFDSSGSSGIPDMYSGRTLSRQHTLNSSISCANGKDTYFIFAPVPGVAYWTTSVNIGASLATAAWTTVTYQDFASLFPTPPASTLNYAVNVNNFRFATLIAELKSTMNQMTWAGTITAFRTRITQEVRLALTSPTAATTESQWILTGFNQLDTPPISDVYSGSVTDGAYTMAFNRDATFTWTPIQVSTAVVPATISTDVLGSVASPFPGCGNFDSIVYKVSVPSGSSDQSFLLRTWACVEYQALITSALYQYTRLSASYDEAALAAYRKILESVPIAVPSRQNANFWQTVLRIIRGITNVTNLIPGPIGAISNGVRAITDGIAAI